MQNIMTQEFDRKLFYRQIFKIGLPVVIQNLIQSLAALLDVFMIGQLGETQITAVSLGNQWIMLFFQLNNAILAVGSMFIAQYWGKRDIESIHRIMGIIFTSSLTFTAIFTAFSYGFTEQIMSLYSSDPAVIASGVTYIRIAVICSVFVCVESTLNTALTATENTVVPLITTMIALVMNLVLNFLLIFGNLGFPKLGVKGAAVATVISYSAATFFVSVCTFVKKYDICARIKNYFSFSARLFKKFYKMGFFIIMCEVSFSIGINIYNIAYKYTGTNAQAALQIVKNFQGISMVLAIGIGTAQSVMLGKLLGANKFDMAKTYFKKFIFLVPASAFILSIITVAASPLFLSLFNIEPSTYNDARNMLYLVIFILPLSSLTFSIVVGTLRSGGDTVPCFTTNLVGVWMFGIPMTFLGAYLFPDKVWLVFLFQCSEEIGKIMVCLPRAFKYKWLKNIT